MKATPVKIAAICPVCFKKFNKKKKNWHIVTCSNKCGGVLNNRKYIGEHLKTIFGVDSIEGDLI